MKLHTSFSVVFTHQSKNPIMMIPRIIVDIIDEVIAKYPQSFS